MKYCLICWLEREYLQWYHIHSVVHLSCYITSCTVNTCLLVMCNDVSLYMIIHTCEYNVHVSSSYHAHGIWLKDQSFARARYYTSFVIIRHAISIWQIILTSLPRARQCDDTERVVFEAWCKLECRNAQKSIDKASQPNIFRICEECYDMFPKRAKTEWGLSVTKAAYVGSGQHSRSLINIFICGASKSQTDI